MGGLGWENEDGKTGGVKKTRKKGKERAWKEFQADKQTTTKMHAPGRNGKKKGKWKKKLRRPVRSQASDVKTTLSEGGFESRGNVMVDAQKVTQKTSPKAGRQQSCIDGAGPFQKPGKRPKNPL